MGFFRRRSDRERDLDDEILAHLALEARQRIEGGETPEEAERSARRDLGSVALIKDRTREAWGFARLESVLQDLRYACRLLRRSPGFTAVAVLTLALGIGANAAIFSVVDAALFRPLPFPDSDRLVRIFSTRDRVSIGGLSALNMRDLAASASSFEGMIVYDRWRKNVSGIGGTDPQETVVGLVPGAYFKLLRISPLLGRVFTPEESAYGRHFVAAISETLWRTRFDADPQILGKTLRINGEVYSIVAVAPDRLPAWMDQTSEPVSVWTPFASPQMWSEASRGARDDFTLGRLKPGVSYDQARAELAGLAKRLAEEHPINRGVSFTIEPLADTRAGPVRPLLLILSGAVAMVLLIACANLAGLLLARNSARSRELAIRAALGSGRWRLVRQMLLETLVLALLGGAAGLALAWAAARLLTRIPSADNLPYITPSRAFPQFVSTRLDLRVLAFAMGVSIVTAILFGFAPAITGTRASLGAALKEGGRGAGAGAGKQRFRRLLVVSEVGLTLVLVFAAALLVQTLVRLERQDPGFQSDHLLLAHVFIPPARYPDADAISSFCAAFGERVRAVPGVLDASVTTGFPPSYTWQQMFTVPGLPVSRAADAPTARFAAVDERYLRTLGLKLLAGRDFRDSDTSTSLPVAVVNEEFARRYFLNQDPIGRQIHPGPPPGTQPPPFGDFGGSSRDVTLVGVVRNFTNDTAARPPAPQIFTLFRQFPGLNYGFKDIVVRTAASPESVVPAVERTLKSLDPDIPLGEVRTMETHRSGQTADRRFTTVLLGAFAGLGTALALIGAYGIVSYLVAQRTRELGVRIAMGAGSADILWLVLRYGLSTGLAGVGLGLAGVLLVRRSMTGLLYGVGASDPVTLAGAAGLLLVVILVASAVPAARAMRIDPIEALRSD